MSNLPDVVLFDLDGTLIDSSPIVVEAYYEAAHQLNLHNISKEFIYSLSGLSTIETAKAMGVRDENLTFVDQYFWSFFEQYCDQVKRGEKTISPLEAVPEIILYLHSKSVPMGLVTSNSRNNASILLESLGLSVYMEVCIGREDVQNPKPSPEPILKAISQFSNIPENPIVWYVGDTDSDVLAASAAKVTAVSIGSKVQENVSMHFATTQQLFEYIKQV